jgi:hypothetical protein
VRFVVFFVALAVVAACSSSNNCPAVPLHCICAGVDPVCENGTWVCNCPDAGDAGTD